MSSKHRALGFVRLWLASCDLISYSFFWEFDLQSSKSDASDTKTYAIIRYSRQGSLGGLSHLLTSLRTPFFLRGPRTSVPWDSSKRRKRRMRMDCRHFIFVTTHSLFASTGDICHRNTKVFSLGSGTYIFCNA